MSIENSDLGKADGARFDMDVPLNDRRFILWDENDGHPQFDSQGCSSDGLIGRVGIDNVYVKNYAHYPDGAPKLNEFGRNECVRGVAFCLSGSKGFYTVMRVI